MVLFVYLHGYFASPCSWCSQKSEKKNHGIPWNWSSGWLQTTTGTENGTQVLHKSSKQVLFTAELFLQPRYWIFTAGNSTCTWKLFHDLETTSPAWVLLRGRWWDQWHAPFNSCAMTSCTNWPLTKTPFLVCCLWSSSPSSNADWRHWSWNPTVLHPSFGNYMVMRKQLAHSEPHFP